MAASMWTFVRGSLPLFVLTLAAAPPPPAPNLSRTQPLIRTLNLRAGDLVEISAGLPAPSSLPANGRIAVEFAGYRKVLHALDPDLYFVYRAPKAGAYTLKASVLENEEPIFNLPRWREVGSIQKLDRFPASTPWPANLAVAFRADLKPIAPGVSKRNHHLEAEPNDSIADAQPIRLGATGADETLHVTGSADELEYFDNGHASDADPAKLTKAGDDWFKLEYAGSTPRLFTANINVIDPFVVAQVRMYTADGKEYRDGANPNERVHQQLEGHRTALTRTFKPGGVYYLRVEANSPGYDLELRLRALAPHRDPREAVRAAMYDHLSQVDAWILNRPRGAAVDRRIRDTGSLLGTHCMSCHTQSGVWGPVGAMLQGYSLENVQNIRHLMNTMYECLRPTNELPEAANNTSLSPLDLGDGPAGTRVAGYNVVMAERLVAPRRLHAMQQQKTANHTLLSADPSGVNAAGPGSNVGPAVVFRFSGEILLRAFRDTRNDKYLKGFEDKCERMLSLNVRYTDDLSNRIEFFTRVFPLDYVALRGNSDEAKNLRNRAMAQVEADARRLRQLQKSDGAWGFSPGESTDGLRWTLKFKNAEEDTKDTDPAPTALAITALAALGSNDKDPAVRRAVDWLLAHQDTHGRWNHNALTGFVTTAYSIHALSRLYPVERQLQVPAEMPGETLADTVGRYRALAHLGMFSDELDALRDNLRTLTSGASHASPQVRYWAHIALGAAHDERTITAQLKGLADPVKMVREAARWGLRQTLLDDKGWDHLYEAFSAGDDLTRQEIAAALVMRADATMTRSNANFPKLNALFERMMLRDPHPAVRAWSARAAWNWWVWNPPVREKLNATFLAALERPEPSALADTALRYQTEALFIANGQKANPSKEHQYPELTRLFDAISKRVDAGNPQLIRRLVNIAATYYSQAGGDGGPGQMGYVTDKSSDAIGKAVMTFWSSAESAKNKDNLKLAIESAANVLHDPLQKRLVDYSSTGPEDLRTLASTSISDPRLISLNGTQEFLEPLMEQFYRGANEPERRAEISGPLVKLFSRARWNLPKTEEQQRIFYKLMLPTFAEERGKLEENTRELKQMDKPPTDWYVAGQLSSVVHSNTDLHTPILVSLVPTKFATPMDESFWLPSLRWLIDYGSGIPEVGKSVAEDASSKAARDRIVDLYVKSLENPTDGRLRGTAMQMAGNTNIRRHPKIAPVLAKARPAYFEKEPADVAPMSAGWKQNWEYFRDHVAPELARPNRDDQLACLGCHGVAGRVPSMELAPADDLGYVKMNGLFSNYKILLERVNEQNVESSKLLRKPLNVQTGQEDGHQGGRRYATTDRAYQILERWVRDAATLKARDKSGPSGAAAAGR